MMHIFSLLRITSDLEGRTDDLTDVALVGFIDGDDGI